VRESADSFDTRSYGRGRGNKRQRFDDDPVFAKRQGYRRLEAEDAGDATDGLPEGDRWSTWDQTETQNPKHLGAPFRGGVDGAGKLGAQAAQRIRNLNADDVPCAFPVGRRVVDAEFPQLCRQAAISRGPMLDSVPCLAKSPQGQDGPLYPCTVVGAGDEAVNQFPMVPSEHLTAGEGGSCRAGDRDPRH
jgi:hypothetical protein